MKSESLIQALIERRGVAGKNGRHRGDYEGQSMAASI